MSIGDIRDFTTPKDLIELLAYMATHKRAARRGSVRKFNAKALTDGIPLSGAGLRDYAEGNTTPERITRYIFKARIEQKDLYEFNPHAYLTDPCSLDFTGDVNEALRLTKMHTTCLTARNFDLGSGAAIGRGDVVEIVCKVKPNGQTNIEICTATKILERAMREDGSGTAQACVSLSGAFEANIVTFVGQPTTSSELPPPAPELPVEDLGDECYVGDDVAYPCLQDTSVRLVVFYHGVEEHGDQSVVLGKLKEIGFAENVMFIIPKGMSKSYASVKQSIETLKSENNLTISEMSLGGWSGGSGGFAGAYGSEDWKTTMLADPSAYTWSGGKTYMEYNPEIWESEFPELAEKLPVMAEEVKAAGGSAYQVSLGHIEILVQILKRLAA